MFTRSIDLRLPIPACYRLLTVFLLAAAAGRGAESPSADLFEKKIRPILAEHCYECHSESSKKVKGGLLLDSIKGLLKGGENGAILIPGKPETSRLFMGVTHVDPDFQMPPKKKLPEPLITELREWIRIGAPMPQAVSATAALAKPDPRELDAKLRWAFFPPKVPAIPAIRNTRWVRTPVDAFVTKHLEAVGLHPAPLAEKRILLRRVTFDLTGLPPTPEEMRAFVADRSTNALGTVVDRLLATPAYGERWARHWLDVVRYTDSFDARGIGGEGDVPESYRYRDWVVRAFNEDMPYDEFVRRQIAGDLMEPESEGGYDPGKQVATTVMAIGEWGVGDADKEKMMTDIVDDQVDVVSRAFLGVTLACARCHDHKFDPFSTEDYYGLAGIFFSSHIIPGPGAKTAGSPTTRIPLASKEELRHRKQREDRIAQLTQSIKSAQDETISKWSSNHVDEAVAYLKAAVRSIHNASVPEDSNLTGVVVQRWAELIQRGHLDLMTRAVTSVGGIAGLTGLHNAKNDDTPSVLANSTDREIAFLSFKVPAKSVALHPSPKGSVSVGWKCPTNAVVALSGGVKDQDPSCGDGIEWIFQVRGAGGRKELSRGTVENGGSQKFSQGRSAASLERIELRAGEMLELAILPRANHGCDTTGVDIQIAMVGESNKVWSLAGDVAESLLASNPHADRAGNPGVWSFFETELGTNKPWAPTGSQMAKLLTEGNSMPFEEAIKIAEAAGAESSFRVAYEPNSSFWSGLREETRWMPESDALRITAMKSELAGLMKSEPPKLQVAHGLEEGGVPGTVHEGFKDAHVHIRGRYDRLGKLVPRHFPTILSGTNPPAIRNSSGRMELAAWLSSPANPLTARVFVNRVWQHHFGEGLVRTANNFGRMGEAPDNPELLDYLAVQFIKSGWSIKALHRLILSSSVYQQSSLGNSESVRLDPDNRLLGRQNRRRLEAESLRDALLFVSGELDSQRGGPSVRDLMNNRRTLYLMTIRSERSNYRSLFDAPDATAIAERRIESTVAPQALFLMNDPFVIRSADLLANRVRNMHLADQPAIITRLYELLYSRAPSREELRVAQKFLVSASKNENALVEFCQALLCSNEFLFVD